MDERKTDRYFDSAWRLCAAQGWCDGFGGTEYLRVRRIWQDSRRPVNVVTFIVEEANRPCPLDARGPQLY